MTQLGETVARASRYGMFWTLGILCGYLVFGERREPPTTPLVIAAEVHEVPEAEPQGAPAAAVVPSTPATPAASQAKPTLYRPRLDASAVARAQLAREVAGLAETDADAALVRVDAILADLASGKSDANPWATADAAIRALAESPSTAMDTGLYVYYEKGPEYVRYPAARALEKRGDLRPVQDLIRGASARLLRPGATKEERFAAVTDLSRTASLQAIPALRAAISDRDADVRLAVARGLYFVVTPGSIPLLRALAKDPDPRVRRQAEQSLQRQQDF